MATYTERYLCYPSSTGTWTNWYNSTPETTSATDTNATTWMNWHDGTCYAGNSHQSRPIQETREERTQREIREKAEETERKRQLQEREDRALALLASLIGIRQTKVYKKTGRLLVKGENFDYLIPEKDYVTRIGKDKMESLCVGIAEKHRYHKIDNAIGLMLALKTDEENFNKKANVVRTIEGIGELPMAAQA